MSKIVNEKQDALQAALDAAVEAQSEADKAKTEQDRLAAQTGTKYQAAADIIMELAPAFPLVNAKATLASGLGKFLENYGGNVLWPTVEEAMLAFQAAIEMNDTIRQVHEDGGKPCGELKTFKLRFTECMPTYTGRTNFSAAAKERAIELGLDQEGSILNPCFDPIEIAKAEAKKEKATADKEARKEYKEKSVGGQIKTDLLAVRNRVVSFLPTLEDAAGIAGIPLDPEHRKQINAMATRLSNAIETMETQAIWSDDFSDYKSK